VRILPGMGDGRIEDGRPTACWPDQPEKQSDQCRLAGAVGTDQAYDPGTSDLKIKVAERDHITKAPAESGGSYY